MEFLAGKILGFVLILTRISAFFATAPLFNWQSIPLPSKITIALLLSAFFAALTTCPYSADILNPLEVLLLLANEFIYGAAMGLVAYCIFTVVRQAGEIIEQQIGLNMSNILDPFSDEPGQPVGMILETLFVLLLFTTESHHLLLQILSRSFDSYGPGFVPGFSAMFESVLKATVALLMLALQMSAPLLAAFLLLMVVLAFMARVAPESNILFLSLPLRVGIGLIMLAVFIPFLADYIKTMVGWINKLIPV
ncbi:MAG: flagellar biosynthetic protein FliR [Planctomycetaceae bacterium]|nr:flagellar biosynthetic protein FliR [Planctomycetaceae bacterium]